MDSDDLVLAPNPTTRDSAEVAALFESLGGGSLTANGWAFGCEFGYWQRSLGLEPMGLLRWASIRPDNLLRGLRSGFSGVENQAALELREHSGHDWGMIQTTYGMHMDHSNMDRTKVSREEARRKLATILGFLRDKLVKDLAAGEKLFVYRTYDHTLGLPLLHDLSAAVRSYGKATLLYVQHSDETHPPFTAVRESDSLIVGYIDHFAVSHFAVRDGQFAYNPAGWEAVCRAALTLASHRTHRDGTREATHDPMARAPKGRDLLITARFGAGVAQEVLGFWLHGRWMGAHGEGPLKAVSWREMPEIPAN